MRGIFEAVTEKVILEQTTEDKAVLSCFESIAVFVNRSMAYEAAKAYPHARVGGEDANGKIISLNKDELNDLYIEAGLSLRENFLSLPRTTGTRALVGALVLECLLGNDYKGNDRVFGQGFGIMKKALDHDKQKFRTDLPDGTVRSLVDILDMKLMPHIATLRQVQALRIGSSGDENDINWRELHQQATGRGSGNGGIAPAPLNMKHLLRGVDEVVKQLGGQMPSFNIRNTKPQ